MNTQRVLVQIILASAILAPTLTRAASEPPVLLAQTTLATGNRSDGEVRKIDKQNNKITLKHGEIKSLDMPGMTMVFQVKDPAMLDQVKAGDKVTFTAEKANGALIVTAIEAAK